MNFAEAITAVTEIVQRPDKLTDIPLAINSAISDCTMRASFANDLVETTLQVNPLLYGDTINLTALVTRFRKFKYLKPTGVRRYLQPIGSDKIFTSFGNIQPDSFYVAGSFLTYTLRSLTPTLEAGYYQYPPVLAGSQTHWMLDLMPYTIIDLAAARIFRIIGDDISFKIFIESGMESFKINRNDYEDSVLAVAK